MEKLDTEILQDMQEQINYCTQLSIQYVSILADNANNIANAISNSECQQILKELISTLIMENDTSRVLSFLNLPIRFVMDNEKAEMIMRETQKALERIDIHWQERLLKNILA
ncbi:hypothetical protein [uncultured Phocaeicola sp.]|uniref:hypothetical protein n=1 Tax=uncultured Phocaeicola sp. TaxID=990718 RepID=UPI0025E7B128|nr:hypothetical protein [uncultured Phocaeicola sp.]